MSAERSGVGRALGALQGLLLAIAGLFIAAETMAQYPTRPIRLIVVTPPGGSPDLVARVLAERLAEALQQQVVVENRPGANGNIAGEAVARAVPDGHTLLVASESLIAINPHVFPNMPFSTLDDLMPVASLASNPFLLSVHPSLPVNSLGELIQHAGRATPRLTYAAGGTQQQIAMEWLKAVSGIDLLHVPYRGGAFAANAAASGEVAMVFAGTSAAPLVHAGKLRALAVTGRQRSPAFPGLPAIAEAYAGFQVTAWHALFAPAGTQPSVVARLHAECNRAMSRADVGARIGSAGMLDAYVSTPEQFAGVILQDYKLYGGLVKRLNITSN